MGTRRLLLFAFFLTSMVSCFWSNKESDVVAVVNQDHSSKSIENVRSRVSSPSEPKTDKSLAIFARYFEKADAVHREAWWVLNAERKPVSKSPFGKVQRALLAAQNVKLNNKSLFRCDKYVVKRDILKTEGFPQKLEIFEKCSEKLGAKKIAEVMAKSNDDFAVMFFPENLEEILGLGATVLNTPINCELKGNEKEQLVSLDCKNWFQERNKEQAIKLDTFNYQMQGQNIIKLRGKVFINLSESRKIESDVPMNGKIFVKETELYPPEEEKDVVKNSNTIEIIDSSAPAAIPQMSHPQPQTYSVPENSNGITPIITNSNKARPDNAIDPDILLQRHKQQQMENQQTPNSSEVQQLEQQLQEQRLQEQQNQQLQEQQSPENSSSPEEPQTIQHPGEMYGR